MPASASSSPLARAARRRPRGWALVVLAGLALGACATHSPPPLGSRTLSFTRRFDEFPIFWAGRSFEGMPLTAADLPRDYDESLGMRVYYGNCRRQGLLGSGGCTLPLEINTMLYKPHSNVGLGAQRKLRVHGVPAVLYDGGRSIELYTGDLAIDVFADTPARALRAASALRPLNAAGQPTALAPPGYRPGVPSPKPVKLPKTSAQKRVQ